MKKRNPVSLPALLLAALLLLGMAAPVTLAAPEGERCSLTLTFTPDGVPASGMTFRIYRVARVNTAKVTFTPIAPYGDYHVLDAPVDWLTRAETLSGYVLGDQLPATAQARSDERGVVRFENLEQGLYLILGERIRRGESYWSPVPCFLSLPNSYDGGRTWTNRVEGTMKPEQTNVPTVPLDRHVRKVWDDRGHGDQRPDSVVVELLKNGELYQSVTLSGANNWAYDWTGLDPTGEWRLVERDPGENYSPIVTRTGITFVVTNTYRGGTDPEPTPTPTPGGGDDDPDPTSTTRPSASAQPSADPSARPSGEPSPAPSGTSSGEPSPVPSGTPGGPDEEEDLGENDVPLGDLVDDPGRGEELGPPVEEDIPDSEIARSDLPQTGQLWWPVPLMAVLGLGLILSGLIRRRRGEVWDEIQ